MFVIYGKEACSYCVKAVDFLKEKNLEFEYISLDSPEKLGKFKSDFPNAKTVPYILKDDFYIGGYSDLTYYVNSYEYGPQ
jgi:glutaredoxin